MVSQLRYSAIIAALGLFFIGCSKAQILKLDHSSDNNGLRIDNSCHYHDDPVDFWVYGCPINTPATLDASGGYWTTCKTLLCDVIFNAGYLSKAKKVMVRAYIEGTPKILISGKLSHNDLIFYKSIGEISSPDGSAQWREIEFDLTNNGTATLSALKFTLGSTGGYVLLDSVTVDLGNENPNPIILDTGRNEIKSHWIRNTCNYVEDYKDFVYYGCPAELGGTAQSVSGFWAPCLQASCQLEFFSGSAVHPGAVIVRAYLSGSAEIRITSKLHPKSGAEGSHLVKTINVENAGDGWRDVVVDLELDQHQENSVVVVEIVGSSDNLAVVDMLAVCVSNDGSMPTCDPGTLPATSNPPGTTTTTISPGTGSTTTISPGTGSTTTKSPGTEGVGTTTQANVTLLTVLFLSCKILALM